MYHLSRIRATGIGPSDARFDQPSPDHDPFEVNCTDAADEPSDTLLWLENGGGKTVFLALLFHVLRPDKAALIGGDGDAAPGAQRRRGAIDEYLLTGDVGHVLCEWVSADSDERLVTGMVAEKRGANVQRSWYMLVVRDPAFSIDQLVFNADGRRVRPGPFIESVQELSRASASGRRRRIECLVATTQKQWLALLSDHSLDPTLFEYQALMNKAEGRAASLFRFRSSAEFVEFFIKLTMNPESLSKVSETLGLVAEKVADLPRKELDLAYCTLAAQRLDVLAAAYTAHRAALADDAAARTGAESLDNGLAAALSRLDDEIAAADDDVAIAEDLQQEADRARREADRRSQALAVRAADALVTALEAAESEAAHSAGEADLTARAWAALPELLRRDRLHGEQSELRAALDEQSTPLRERRDAVLRLLRDRLGVDLATVRDEQTSSLAAAEAHEDNEEEARQHYNEMIAAESSAASKAEFLERQAAEGEDAIAEARATGLLSPSEAPIEGLRRARDAAESAVTALVVATERRRELVERLADATLRSESARDAARETATEATAAADRISAAADERSALEANPLSVELVGAGADLELVGFELVSRLHALALEHRAAAIRTAAEADDDRRAAASLETDRLLPARREVDTLCATLKEAGIRSAVPGWRYLVEAVRSELHGATIAENPALLEGIVVADTEFEAAKSLLADVGPAAAIVLGAGSVLTAATTTPNPADQSELRSWVVPPDPALFDPSTADGALELRQAKLATVDERIATETAVERTLLSLVSSVETHLEQWPTGALAAAAAQATALHDAAAAAHSALVAAVAQRDETAQLASAAETAVTEAHEAKEKTARLVDRLVELERQSGRALVAAREAESLREQATEARAAAEGADLTRRTAQRDAAECRSQAQRAENAAGALARTLGELPDPGPGSGVDPDQALAHTTLAEIESRYAEADRLLTSAVSDSEVARQLQRVDEALAELGGRINTFEPEVIEKSAALAATPHAADETARHAAERAARSQRDHLARAHSEIRGELLVARKDREGLSEPDRPVDLGPLPAGPAELAALALEAERAAEVARQERVTAEEELRRAHEALGQLRSTRTNLASTRQALQVLLGERVATQAAPFSGDATAAVSAAIERLRLARAELEDTTKAEHDAIRAVTGFAREERWSGLTGELPSRLHTDDVDALAADAATLCAQVRLKMDRLKDDIEHLDRYRELLLDSLADAVSAANASLRRARSQSQMPLGLGAWSHHPFLKIAVALPADGAELRARLRRFTNDLVERAAVTSMPREAALVCEALLACTEREVSVEVLKPNKAQRLVYVPIAELAPLSGGMRATAAIALFCTLAKVRSSNQGGRIGVGTLILDNPLGEASSTYLVALQRLMAEKNGIQLLYTSAVNDYDAIRLFPVVNRLNNEAGRKSQLSYVVADPTFLKQLAGGDGDADSSLVIGSRLVRRKPIQLTFDVLAAAADQLEGDDL